MQYPIANYAVERQQFTQLLDDNGRLRILMLQGESGTGKTCLLENCLANVPPQMHALSVQLRGKDTSVAEIFNRLGRRIGWQKLPKLSTQLSTFAGDDAINWQSNVSKQLRTALQLPDLNRRRQNIIDVTDALFTDVQNLATPTLLAIDTYEQATTELDNWFNAQFLPWIADTDRVRVLVAGQKVPQISSDFRHCASRYELKGIADAEAWLPIAQALGHEIPSIDFLAGVCAAFQGNPSNILKFIRLQPRTAVSAQPGQTVSINRVYLRQQMTTLFDLQDLRVLCFDLDVDYENIGESGRKEDKVIGLITFMQRRGRLPELVSLLRMMRPNVEW